MQTGTPRRAPDVTVMRAWTSAGGWFEDDAPVPSGRTGSKTGFARPVSPRNRRGHATVQWRDTFIQRFVTRRGRMRHPLLLAGGVSLAALAGAVALARSAPADAPALFRGDLAHTGVYRAAPLTRFGGVQWRVQTGGPVQSTPVVANGT